MGKMGKGCYPKGLWGLGFQKYPQILNSAGNKVWMEDDIHFEFVDEGDYSKIHSSKLTYRLDQTTAKILQRRVYFLESYY